MFIDEDKTCEKNTVVGIEPGHFYYISKFTSNQFRSKITHYPTLFPCTGSPKYSVTCQNMLQYYTVNCLFIHGTLRLNQRLNIELGGGRNH